MSWRRWSVLAGVITAAIATGWFALSRSQSTPPATSGEEASTAVSHSEAPPERAMSDGGGTPAPTQARHEWGTAEVEAQRALAREQLRLAARPCYLETRDDPAGTLRFRYRLVVERGNCDARDIRVLDSSLRGTALQACILEKLADATWWAGNEENAEWTVEETIGVTDIPLL